MTSRTNVRCMLCGKLLKFIDINNGKSLCDDVACLGSALGWIDTDTYVGFTKAQLFEEIIKELEKNIDYDNSRISNCQELLQLEQEEK